MYSKAYFLIIIRGSPEPLILRKKGFQRWELPIIKSSDELPINTLVENFMRKTLNIGYKYLGKSSVVNRYEWPKEFMQVTGKRGEENHFVFIKLNEDINMTNLKSKEHDGFDFEPYANLIERITFKNHRPVLRKVLDDLQLKMLSIKQDQLHQIKREKQDYFHEIDRLF